MYDLYNLIESLCEKNGEKVGGMCRAAKISKGILSDLKNGRKKTLSAETISKIAAHFHVSTDYILGLVDEYGLSDDDWDSMGLTYKSSRELSGAKISDAVDGQVLTEDQLADFEDNGAPLTPDQLVTACGMIGADPILLFAPWADKLWENKKEPVSTDGNKLYDKIAGLDDDLITALSEFLELASKNPEAAKRFLSFAAQELRSLPQSR